MMDVPAGLHASNSVADRVVQESSVLPFHETRIILSCSSARVTYALWPVGIGAGTTAYAVIRPDLCTNGSHTST